MGILRHRLLTGNRPGYSVGMKIRLGFSVAAYLEPEILVIDEVLAVGDFDFQKKCLNKMEDVGKQGQDVESHDGSIRFSLLRPAGLPQTVAP